MAGHHASRFSRSDRLYVRGGRALGALLGVVRHLRALGERLKAAGGDRHVMYEEIVPLLIPGDEPSGPHDR